MSVFWAFAQMPAGGYGRGASEAWPMPPLMGMVFGGLLIVFLVYALIKSEYDRRAAAKRRAAGYKPVCLGKKPRRRRG